MDRSVAGLKRSHVFIMVDGESWFDEYNCEAAQLSKIQENGQLRADFSCYIGDTKDALDLSP